MLEPFHPMIYIRWKGSSSDNNDNDNNDNDSEGGNEGVREGR